MSIDWPRDEGASMLLLPAPYSEGEAAEEMRTSFEGIGDTDWITPCVSFWARGLGDPDGASPALGVDDLTGYDYGTGNAGLPWSPNSKWTFNVACADTPVTDYVIFELTTDSTSLTGDSVLRMKSIQQSPSSSFNTRTELDLQPQVADAFKYAWTKVRRKEIGLGTPKTAPTRTWRMYWEYKEYSPALSSTATAAHAGTQLTDSAGEFVSKFVQDTAPDQATITNVTDGSTATVSTVDSETQITHTALSGGTNNDWEIGDAYTISSEPIWRVNSGMESFDEGSTWVWWARAQEAPFSGGAGPEYWKVTSAVTPALNTWHWLEYILYRDADSGKGRFVFRVDGVDVFNVTDQTSLGDLAIVQHVYPLKNYTNAEGSECYYDYADFKVR